jgi:hypothetical protein
MESRYLVSRCLVVVLALGGAVVSEVQARQLGMAAMSAGSNLGTGPWLLACGGGGSGSYRKPPKPGHHREASPAPVMTNPAPSAQTSNS